MYLQMNKMTTKACKSVKVFVIKNRYFLYILIHLIQTAIAHYVAFIIRFESITLTSYQKQIWFNLPILMVIRLILFLKEGLYKNLWRYSGVSELIKLIRSTIIGSLIFLVVTRYLIGDTVYPRSIYVLDWLLIMVISGGSRLFLRVYREYLIPHPLGKRILIIGADDAGEVIVRDMKNSQSSYNPIGFIDEDPLKKGLMIHNVPIFGPISLIPYVIEENKVDEILITIPIKNSDNIRKIYELSKPYNVSIKKLPAMNEILNGNISVAARIGQHLINANLITEEQLQHALSMQKKEGGRLGSKLVKLGYISEEKLILFLNQQFGISHMKLVSLEDLLQREPVRTDIQSVRDFIKNKSVLITGAGGSIGSELCRQIIKYYPSKLILFDRYENSLFKIDLELKNTNNGMNGEQCQSTATTLIGDILDNSRLEDLFSKYKPQVIFHAAAHKHVPLMEHNPLESVKNNIFGTRNLINVAKRHHAESFVMISTDKAVNPTSIMGTTKRVAEFLTVSANDSCNTKFTVVRFGNVLGSNGSVIDVFKDQLKHGGPLTVTHPEIKRFFMLIPEAVQLVVIAAASGNGGEIFVLDMGEQIKIVSLAEDLIRLSGFMPHDEIKIKFTGLRPGEKLYEELFGETEKIIPTLHNKLKITIPEIPSRDDLDKYIEELERVVWNNSFDDLIPAIQKLVPGYRNEHIVVT